MGVGSADVYRRTLGDKKLNSRDYMLVSALKVTITMATNKQNKDIVLGAIKNVTNCGDIVDATHFAQNNMTVYNVGLEAVRNARVQDEANAVSAFGEFIDYLHESGRITLEESENRDSWITKFRSLYNK